MSDSEKLMEDGLKFTPEPLILRPPVGGEALGGTNISGHRIYVNLLKNRIIIGVIANIMLLVIAVAFMVFFFYLHHSASSFDGSCNVFTVNPDLQLEEHYRYEPRMAVIDHDRVLEFPASQIFHMLENMLTFIKTPGGCFVHSLQPEVASAIPTDENVLQRIKESSQPNMKIKADFDRQIWLMSPEQDQSPKLRQSASVANCSSLPIFKLIQMIFPSPRVISMLSDSESFPSSSICPEGCSEEVGGDELICRCENENPQPLDQMSGTNSVPRVCSVYTQLIGGALPNERMHTLPEMTIVKCRHSRD